MGDYTEANTRFIFERTSPKGIIIDCIYDLKNKINKNLAVWRGDLNIINKSVNSNNIDILKFNDAMSDLDLFSLDIDGIDYWILNELPKTLVRLQL